MSQKSNVNKDAYEQAGRDRPGDDILHDINKQQLTQAAQSTAGGGATENFIPGATPVGEKSGEASPSSSAASSATTGEADKSSNSSSGSM